MKKKLIMGLISLLCVSTTCLTSCMKNGVDGKDGTNGVDGSAGKDGKDGVSIVSITKTSTSGLIDTYTILYSDGHTSLFTVTNGSNGEQGIQGERGSDGHTSVITIGSNGNWYVDGVDTGFSAKGEKGDKGEDGKTYETIVSVEKTGSDGNVDTYTITYADGKTYSFTVTNGADGSQGIQGDPGEDGHTPVVTIGSNGNWFVDGKDTGKSTKGEKGEQGDKGETGEKGDTGKSAYDLYKEAHPEYTGSEEEWLEDLASGKLRKITIDFNTNGGSLIESITTSFGSYITVETPTKDGSEFVGWKLNGSLIDINTYVFMASCTLEAEWKDADTVKVTFDANGGVVVPGTMNVVYGKEYTLPTPSKKYQTFSGWKYETTSIPLTGTWDYTHYALTLKAEWTAPKIYVDLSVDAEYGAVDTSRVTITEGDYYTLPVPSSIKAGYTFYGWYLDDQRVTDENGHSLDICEWDKTTKLTASYCVKISDIYQFMKLGGQDLNGNYLVTQDLDFKGLGVNAINSFTGTFDFGGHTMSNFVLLSGATGNVSSGLFKTVEGGIIKNLTIENATCNEENASGLIGNLKTKAMGIRSSIKSSYLGDCEWVDSSITNITIKNSFNKAIHSVLVGSAEVGDPENAFYHYAPSKTGEIDISNVLIENSGDDCFSEIVYSVNCIALHTRDDYSSIGEWHFREIQICMDDIVIDNDDGECKATFIYNGENMNKCDEKSNADYGSYEYGRLGGKIKIENCQSNILSENGICYIRSGYSPWNISVSRTAITGDTTCAWGYVDVLEDSCNYGTTSYWGAKLSTHCVDLGGEKGKYKYNRKMTGDFNSSDADNIKSSVNLYPDANGNYTYWSQDGVEAVINDASLIEKQFFTSLLGFDEANWNLDDIDVANGKYPMIA